MNAIDTDRISFKVDHFQLNDISLSIPAGQITSIVGPNGSGKSTFLKIVSKLLAANSGSILVQNMDAKKYKAKEFARTIAMLPQSKDALPNLTVRELVSFGRSPYQQFLSNRCSKEENDYIIREAMELTKVVEYEDRLFYSLSGGEQQKVRLAMALAQKTDILLLDEPTTYLDIAHQFELMELMQEINETYHMTIIMVLHDLQQAATYSDYMIALKHGKLMEHGPPKELLTASFLKAVYEIDARIRIEDGMPFIIPIRKRSNKGLQSSST